MRENIENYRNRLQAEMENLQNNLNLANEELNRVRDNQTATNNINQDIASINEGMNRVNIRLNDLSLAERTISLIDSLENLYRQRETLTDPQLIDEAERDISDIESRLEGELDPDNVINEVWREIGGKPNIPTREDIRREIDASNVSGDNDADSNTTPENEQDITESVEAPVQTPGTNPVDDTINDASIDDIDNDNDLASRDLPNEKNQEYFEIYLAKIDEAMRQMENLEQEIESLKEARRNETRPVVVEELADKIKEKEEQLTEFNGMTADNLITCQREILERRDKLTKEMLNEQEKNKIEKERLDEQYKSMISRAQEDILAGNTPKMSMDKITEIYLRNVEKLNDKQKAKQTSVNNELASLANNEQRLQEHAARLGVNLANVRIEEIKPEDLKPEEITPGSGPENNDGRLTDEEIAKLLDDMENDPKYNPDLNSTNEPNLDDLMKELEEARGKNVQDIIDSENEIAPITEEATIEDNPDKQLPAVIPDKELDDIVDEINHTNNPEQRMSLLNKALLAAGGFAVGVGLSCVPGVGTIRMAVAGVKLGASAINAWAKGHPNGKVANMINNFKERHPKIAGGIKAIHDKTKSEPLNVFINGMAAGYIAGNVFEMITGNTVAEAVVDHFRDANVPDGVIPPSGDIVEPISEPAPVEQIAADIPDMPVEIPEMIPGAEYDLSGLSQGLISSDSTNYLNLITEAGKDAVFDKEVINAAGEKMWHFKQANGLGYAWFKADDVIGALGKQAAEIANATSLNL